MNAAEMILTERIRQTANRMVNGEMDAAQATAEIKVYLEALESVRANPNSAVIA